MGRGTNPGADQRALERVKHAGEAGSSEQLMKLAHGFLVDHLGDEGGWGGGVQEAQAKYRPDYWGVRRDNRLAKR